MRDSKGDWFWHSVEVDVSIGGLKVATLGASKYLLNDDDEPVTLGCHEIYLRHGMLYEKTGALENPLIYRGAEFVSLVLNDHDRGKLLLDGRHGDKFSSNMVIADKSKIYDNKTGHIHMFYIASILSIIVNIFIFS